MNTLHILQHTPKDDPGSILEWAASRQWELRIMRTDEGEPLPEEVQNLLILGGPMNIYQHRECPWLVPEKELIVRSIEAGRPILGICLGGQLLADALGAKITQNPVEEIGWFPVSFTSEARSHFPQLPEEDLTVLHWHGDTFTLPRDAVRLAYSKGCAEQGFLWKDRILGLQFHPEASMPRQIGPELKSNSGQFVQSIPDILSGYEDYAPKVKGLFFRLLDFLFLR